MLAIHPSKKARPCADSAAVARLCHALSDETRLAILERLRNDERCVCDLVDLLSAGQSRLSFHLKTLRDAGLVVDRRDGRWVHYSINPAALSLLGEYLSLLTGRADPAGKAGGGCCRKPEKEAGTEPARVEVKPRRT
jgi:ArsR family transcriptional regulator, arsenate/arsenite/antimonite-responsive transcriptional repressor